MLANVSPNACKPYGTKQAEKKTRESIKIIYQLNYEMPVYEIGLN